jgi:hypothetical protein
MKAIKLHLALLTSSSHRLFIICSPHTGSGHRSQPCCCLPSRELDKLAARYSFSGWGMSKCPTQTGQRNLPLSPRCVGLSTGQCSVLLSGLWQEGLRVKMGGGHSWPARAGLTQTDRPGPHTTQILLNPRQWMRTLMSRDYARRGQGGKRPRKRGGPQQSGFTDIVYHS